VTRVEARGLSRRGVLGAGALVVAFSLAPRAFAQEGGAGQKPVAPGLPGSLKTTPYLDAWIRVGADGQITVFTGKAELGQGIKTALIQVAAEELDVPPQSLRLVTADTGQTPNEGVTAGSHSMQDSGTAILNAAANVRQLLTDAAARQWGVSADSLATTGAGGLKARDGRTLGYGPLAAGLALHVEARPDVPRRGGAHRTLGTDLPRIDIPAKLTGGEAYVQDLRLPGMLHARVVRGPSDGTVLDALDVAAVQAMPGVVQVVRNGRFCAVVAEREWTAIQALQRLQRMAWRRTAPPIPVADPHAAIQQAASQDEVIFEAKGPAAAAARTVRARYTKPYLMHGSIGPSCAVALFKDGAMTVWTHSQGVYPLRKAVAELLRLPAEKVRCIHAEGAGCYGHNGADDVAADAALAAMAVPGRPVRLQWMRDQEHGWEPLGTAMVVEAEATLDAQNRIANWRYDVWSPSHNGRPTTAGGLLAGAEVEPAFPPQVPKPIPMPEGGGDRNGVPIYQIPAGRVTSHFIADSPVRVSALRSLGGYFNVFAVECLMDELARAGGVDPVAFRLAHLGDPCASDVVKLCAQRFGWGGRPRGDGRRGCGFAFARYKNLAAYCAVALEVEVEHETGAIAVRRAVSAVEAGEAVNPDGIRNQIEGAIVQSLSWTGIEAVGFDAAHRTSFDWSVYPLARFKDVPAVVEVHVLDRPGQPFLGAGEAGQGPAGAALANALADATGLRLRDLPLSPDRVKAALGI
jgi:CO/xanthine dehydrogenase Mo-binding subunit